MGNKKGGFLHSQIVGIVWLSVALLIIAGVAFFSSRRTAQTAQTDTTAYENGGNWHQCKNTTQRNQYNKLNNNKFPSTTESRAGMPATGTASYDDYKPAARRQPLVVELNSADTTTLQLLHGIGPTYARRIVRYRERLGGFRNAGQLLEVYGITPELLSHIGPSLSLDTTAIRRIDINNVELKQLIKHPYIEYYQARDIVRLRQRGTVFRCADDLRAVPSMADSTLERLLPYIDFDGQK